MSRLREIFKGRSRELKPPPQVLSAALPETHMQKRKLEAATGEEKKRLEGECKKYLENPNGLASSEFHEVIYNIILSNGGTIIGGKDEGQFGIYSTLRNEEDGATISLNHVHLRNGTHTTINIASEGVRERFVKSSMTSPKSKGPIDLPATWTISLPQRPVKISSFVSGKNVWVGIRPQAENNKELGRMELRNFAQRVFEVYKRQGQQAQPLTPQP